MTLDEAIAVAKRAYSLHIDGAWCDEYVEAFRLVLAAAVERAEHEAECSPEAVEATKEATRRARAAYEAWKREHGQKRTVA